MSQNPHNLLTVKETAQYLRIPIPTVYYLVQRGQLPAIQIGGRWRIKKDRLDEEVLKLNATEAAKGNPVNPGKILVVDDQQEILDLLKMALSSRGYEADLAPSGIQGLKMVEAKAYDLLFLDLHLPDMAGEEVFEKATELAPNLHVVIMTGFSTVQSLEKILSCGPVTVLQKPFKIEQLLRVTEVILGRQS
jgi:excisionase family DNA binding protein